MLRVVKKIIMKEMGLLIILDFSHVDVQVADLIVGVGDHSVEVAVIRITAAKDVSKLVERVKGQIILSKIAQTSFARLMVNEDTTSMTAAAQTTAD